MNILSKAFIRFIVTLVESYYPRDMILKELANNHPEEFSLLVSKYIDIEQIIGINIMDKETGNRCIVRTCRAIKEKYPDVSLTDAKNMVNNFVVRHNVTKFPYSSNVVNEVPAFPGLNRRNEGDE